MEREARRATPRRVRLEPFPPQLQAGDALPSLRQLIQNSGIYALASFVLPLVTLVLSPFLTHTLSRSDYGVLAVLTTAITLLVGLTQFGLNSAFFRAYNYDYTDKQDKKAVLSVVCLLLLTVSLVLVLCLLALAPTISTWLFGSPIYSTPVSFAALAVFAQNLTVPGLSWLRAENRAWLYSLLAITNLLLNLLITLLCVGVLGMGVAGALLAVGAGYAFVAICTFPVMLFRAGFRFRLDVARNLLAFGLPLVSNTISLWVLQLSDRYLLSRLGSLAETASYTVGYSLGGVLGVVVLAPFSLAWPTTMYAIAKRADAPALFRTIFRWYSLFLLFATAGLALVAVECLTLLFPPAYYAALPTIPLVGLSILFYGLYSYFTLGISLKRKTWLAVLLTSSAALANVGLNLFFIPLYGSMGAAFSTLLAYALLALAGYLVNQRLYPLALEVGGFLLALGVGLVLWALALALAWWQDLQGGYTTLLYLGGLLLYTLFLALFGRRPLKPQASPPPAPSAIQPE